ncbi:MAG: hypothetical protein ACR2GY_13430 [Phycisphaerales bacterium]
MCWLWSSAVDPDVPLSDTELLEIATHEARRANLRNGQVPLLLMAPVFVLFFILFANINTIKRWVGSPALAMFVIFLSLAVVFVRGSMAQHHFLLKRAIRTECRRRSYEVCLRCGYRLEDTISRCPECGRGRK